MGSGDIYPSELSLVNWSSHAMASHHYLYILNYPTNQEAPGTTMEVFNLGLASLTKH